MVQQKIDGSILKDMILAAANLLEKNKKNVDALNVFPVPDGDTGTNMSLTMMAAAKEVKGTQSDSVSDIADALARGSLKGARGNSGVILSQLFRGFAKGIKGYKEIDGYQFAVGLKTGVETAYKAVMKPTEGTILTVARVSTEQALLEGNKSTNVLRVLDALVENGDKILQKTPEMLPVLKQAGVVDAGGMGLLYIYQGFKAVLDGEEIIAEDFDDVLTVTDDSHALLSLEQEEIKFGYCTEFFIINIFPSVTHKEIERLKEKLQKIGDSLIVVGDENLIKVHVHSNMPGKVLQFALRLGELSNIKIDNMREQHRHIIDQKDDQQAKATPVIDMQKKYGIVAVATGDGITRIFEDLSVDQVIEGGQTMNPSIEDIHTAIERIPANNIFVLPNNSNIILAAEQAKSMTNKNVAVIPSKSIPQGLAAVLAYNPDLEFDANVERMTGSLQNVKTGQVTYAVRNSSFGEQTINEGDVIGLSNGSIRQVGKDISEVGLGLLKEIVTDEDEIITIFYGKDIRDQEANRFVEKVQEAFPQCDVELHTGGQPLYYYIFSVE
ncbi:MAG: DAK2 domain-containing protein [Clostridia bacterium]